MNWGNKEKDWEQLVTEIQSEIDANVSCIPVERINDIQHYLAHDEYSMAFEYLFLELIERTGAKLTLGPEKANEMALLFNLNDENECMIDGAFWGKFQTFLAKQSP